MKSAANEKWQSAIFKGHVRHRRFEPKAHAFNYPLFMLYLDLDELPELFAKKWYCSSTRFNLLRFKREDFFAPEQPDLKQAVMKRMAPFVEGEICSVRALMHAPAAPHRSRSLDTSQKAKKSISLNSAKPFMSRPLIR